MNKPKFNPNKPFEVVDAKPAFDPNKSFEVVDDVSQLESGLRGLAQGVSFGFADELTGGLESLLSDKSYEQARDESRANYDAAQEANPISYGTGEVGGALATAFIPGMGALNAGKAATFAGRAGLAAVQGGLTGAGLSTENDAMGIVKDTAMGAATGAAMQGVGEKILAPALSKAGRFVKDKVLDKTDDLSNIILKKAGKTLADISEADTARYLANPEAVNASPSIGELAEDVLKSSKTSDSLLSQMYDQASVLSSKAWETLDGNQSVPKNSLKQAIAGIQDELLTDGVLLGENQARAYQKLNKLVDQLDEFPDVIPEPTLKKIIQNLDANINWNDPNGKVVNDALRDVRVFVDSTLKNQNPNYASAMKSTEDVSKAIQTVKSAFENRQNPENFDKFIKGVKNLDNKSEYSNVVQALDKIKRHTGYDLREQILNSQAKSAFMKDTTNGSRKTLAGALVGSGAGSAVGPLGSAVGGAIGGIAGGAADKYAGQLFKSVLNGKIAADKAMPLLAPKFGKYASPLMEAAKRGNKSLAATVFLLQQKDPNFRKIMNQEEE